MYKSTEIARFVRTHLRDGLPEFAGKYKKRDILRMRGHLVQWVFVGVSRGGWIRVSPSLSVLGPHIYFQELEYCKNKDGSFNSDGLVVAISLDGESASASRRWSFQPETLLDEGFAKEIIKRLGQDSPISFITPLEDVAIDKALRWFGRDRKYWSADLFLAFFNMTRGAPSARADLARAFELFRRHSHLSTDKPLRDWEAVLRDRFTELEARLGRDDCIALCRTDAEAHARLLGLPSIVWPPEWPERVPPWPRQETSMLASTLERLLGRREK